MTWTCCGTARWRRCSAGSGRRPRWARSCAPSPGATCSQLEKAAREFLAELAAAGAAAARRGHAGVHRHRLDAETGLRAPEAGRQVRAHEDPGQDRCWSAGLNALAAAISTPLAAPVIAATRLRGGNAASARGAASLAAEAIGTARDCRLHRDDHRPDGLGVLLRRGDRRDPPRRRAVLRHRPDERQHPRRDRRHPRGRLDARSATRARSGTTSWTAWISDAEVAEMQYTAFASKKGQAVTARLIVRRVRDLNKQGRARARTSCSPSGATTPCSPTPRSSWSRPRGSTATTPIVEQVFADRHRRPPRSPAIRGVHRERRLAGHRRHGAQPAPRRRRPGRPALRQGPRPRPSAAT